MSTSVFVSKTDRNKSLINYIGWNPDTEALGGLYKHITLLSCIVKLSVGYSYSTEKFSLKIESKTNPNIKGALFYTDYDDAVGVFDSINNASQLIDCIKESYLDTDAAYKLCKILTKEEDAVKQRKALAAQAELTLSAGGESGGSSDGGSDDSADDIGGESPDDGINNEDNDEIL